MSPGGSAGQWGLSNHDRVPWGSQSEPEESVRQVKQTARQPWSWINKRKRVEEQILGWQTVMRSLLGGSRGRCWSDEVKHPAGDRQVRWPLLQGFHVNNKLRPNNNLTQSTSVSPSTTTFVSLLPAQSPQYLWSCTEKGENICSSHTKKWSQVTFSEKWSRFSS